MLQKICKSFDGTEIYYIMNKGHKEPLEPFLVFIHGAGSNHTVYKPFFTAFEHLNFIALDIRNHGKSSTCPLDAITIHNSAKDIATILAQEQIHEVILIGNSLGASIAMEFYKLYKKKTKKLILFTLFSKRYIKAAGLLNALARILSCAVTPFHRNKKKKCSDYHKYAKRPIWYYPYLDISGTSIATILQCIRELFATPLYASNIHVPTQIFICTDDWSTKNSLIKSDCRSNTYIETVDIKANHVILTRQYEEVLLHVQKFLAE